LKLRGVVNRMLCDYKGSLDDLNQSQKLSHDPFTSAILGATKRILNDFQGSLENLNQANKLQPNNPDTLQLRGATNLKLGDYKGSLEDLNQSNQLRPDDPVTLQLRGVTKLKLGDYKGSLEDLNQSNQLEPNNSFTLEQKIATKQEQCLLLQHNLKLAKKSWNFFFDTFPPLPSTNIKLGKKVYTGNTVVFEADQIIKKGGLFSKGVIKPVIVKQIQIREKKNRRYTNAIFVESFACIGSFPTSLPISIILVYVGGINYKWRA